MTDFGLRCLSFESEKKGAIKLHLKRLFAFASLIA
jgi:hypothetical protein